MGTSPFSPDEALIIFKNAYKKLSAVDKESVNQFYAKGFSLILNGNSFDANAIQKLQRFVANKENATQADIDEIIQTYKKLAVAEPKPVKKVTSILEPDPDPNTPPSRKPPPRPQRPSPSAKPPPSATSLSGAENKAKRKGRIKFASEIAQVKHYELDEGTQLGKHKAASIGDNPDIPVDKLKQGKYGASYEGKAIPQRIWLSDETLEQAEKYLETFMIDDILKKYPNRFPLSGQTHDGTPFKGIDAFRFSKAEISILRNADGTYHVFVVPFHEKKSKNHVHEDARFAQFSENEIKDMSNNYLKPQNPKSRM